MWLNAIILFLSAFLGGLIFFFVPSVRERNFNVMLVFSGSYLFSITLIHILPEVYLQYEKPFLIGAWVLAGFLLQLLLGNISSGIEHGHIHHNNKHVHLSPITPLVLLFGLGIHSILEGTILAHPVKTTIHDHAGGILLGIVLHKFPAAIALISIFFHQKIKTIYIFLYLLLFSLASPLGLIFTSLLSNSNIFSSGTIIWLYALVCGSFLHISTTIFFESSPQHHVDFKRLLLIFLGAGLAIIIELFL